MGTSCRRRVTIMVSCAATVMLMLSGTGMGSKKSSYDAEVVATGKNLFLQSCSACHGPDAKGLPRLGKDLTESEFVEKLTDDDLLVFIKRGRPSFDPANTTRLDMPPKGGNPALTDEQLKAIIAYIRSLED